MNICNMDRYIKGIGNVHFIDLVSAYKSFVLLSLRDYKIDGGACGGIYHAPYSIL
jgi:hypothetical protein